MNERHAPVRTPSAKGRWTRSLLAVALAAGAVVPAGNAVAQGVDDPAATTKPIALRVPSHGDGATLTDGHQGFSVESADFAHGFLTEDLMAQRMKTLGHNGVLRLGGYSMDLVWPAFGAYAGSPAPAEAIGGTVDQSDLDALKALLRATGWKATLGVPLKAVIDPAKLKDPTKDPAPAVTMDQVIAEVKAAHATLGDDLLSVEVGNEFDNVTTLTGAEMWNTMKSYQAAIRAAVPHAKIRVAGPSANTAATNTKLQDVSSAALADSSVKPQSILSELSSHLYPGSHCGTSTMTIPQLMSADTYTRTRTKLDGIRAIGEQFGGRIPMTINESNSASCSGQPGVSDSYATSLWSLDYLLQTAQSGIDRVEFHTNTAAVCGDFKPRTSADYPISYRYYGAFCASDQTALAAGRLAAAPLYYGLWAFHQVPQGKFVDLAPADSDLATVRAYGVEGRDGSLTVVLINVQDPATAGSSDDSVTLALPKGYRKGRAVTLRSSAPEGLASLDAGRITLGGASVTPTGAPSGKPAAVPVPVGHGSTTVDVAAGTAQIITFTR
ncbi:glycosyl hydrolase family 79 C-terminal domain-containing protein [Streptomyces sp. NPDC058231]|uniref:glycosyl hydrolase family 79 C-terminal domain-containing protein n=1 Tax=Streptomyces sp. NPDC058231 TaxID=3346392 RepID=UPI0036E82129